MTDKNLSDEIEKSPQDRGKAAGEEKENISRRRLLKGLGAGGAVVAGQEVLPENWSRPLVDSVIVPAHAQTTTDDDESREGDDFNDGKDEEDDGRINDDPE